jgi:type II secretory pathway pseudopilin PulG
VRRGEQGFTIVPAMVVLVVVVTLGAAVLGLALRRQETSVADRWVVRAAQAADAGADIAGWRLNRTLVSAGTAGLAGLATDTARQLGCTQVGATGFAVVKGSGSWCAATGWASIGDGAEYSYTLSLDANALGSGLDDVVVRKVVVTGRSRGVQRRLLVVFRLDVDPSHPSALFRRWHEVRCPAIASGAAPDAGCPDVGL